MPNRHGRGVVPAHELLGLVTQPGWEVTGDAVEPESLVKCCLLASLVWQQGSLVWYWQSMKGVTWYFTPSQPLQSYQGEYERECDKGLFDSWGYSCRTVDHAVRVAYSKHMAGAKTEIKTCFISLVLHLVLLFQVIPDNNHTPFCFSCNEN